MKKIIRDDLEKEIDKDRLSFTTSKDEHIHYLIEKITEELTELKESDYEDVREYADVFQVLYSLAKLKGIDKVDIENSVVAKHVIRGTFQKGLLLNI